MDALLLLASREITGTPAPLKIAVNGSPQAIPTSMAQTLGPQVLDVSSLAHAGNNTIEISGGMAHSLARRQVTDYCIPWKSPLAVPQAGPLKLNVMCDRTHLDVCARVTCTVLAERIGSVGHGVMIAEIGIPPGVDVDREGLQKQMSENRWNLCPLMFFPIESSRTSGREPMVRNFQ